MPDKAAGSPFCKTCLKNQHLYNESLASYFPSEDTPNYQDWEIQFPAFKKSLEERYPQVCEDCEAGALASLWNTNYAAKADNLRRIMDKTRPGQVSYRSDWRNLAAFVGGWMWTASWIGQILWDAMGLVNSETALQGAVGEYVTWILSLAARIGQALGLSDVVLFSTELMNSVAWYALVLGLLSLWWNPRLQLWLEIKKRGRIVGKWDFYKLQATSFVIRCAAWAYIVLPITEPESRTIDTIHYSVLFFGALVSTCPVDLIQLADRPFQFTYISFRPIRIDYTPRVIFQDLTPERLVASGTRPVPTGFDQGASSDLAQDLNTHTYRTGFSINDFAPQTQPPIPAPAPYRPLTPPTDEEGDRDMDWTPSHATLPPAPLYRPTRPTAQQPQSGPFHGHLPANVVSPAHRLRNPPNQPKFRSASMIKDQMRFKPLPKSMQDNASETSGIVSLSAADLSPMKIAEPRFFPDSDRREETGLENLFSNVFSIAEDPAEVRAAQQLRAHSPTPARSSRTSIIYQWCLPLILVLALAAALKYQPWQKALETTWMQGFLALND